MNIGGLKKTLAELVDANADAGHQRMLSRAAAVRGDLREVVRRQAAADRAEARLDALIEQLDAVVDDLARCEAPGVVGAAPRGYATDTAAVPPGRPSEGDPGPGNDEDWLQEIIRDDVELHRAARSRGRQRVRVELRRGETVLARGALWRAEGQR